METVRVVRGHHSLGMCALLALAENGRVMRVAGDPDQPRADRPSDIAAGAMHQGTFLTIAAYQEAAREAP
jgi:hypothetical protein